MEVLTSNDKWIYYFMFSFLLGFLFPATSVAFISQPRNCHLYCPTKIYAPPLLLGKESITVTSPGTKSTFEEKREEILNRGEAFFQLNLQDGSIEFGSTARLVTTLEKNPLAKPVINQWLAKEHRVATSLWDPAMMQNLGNNLYTLELMAVQFVTITLAPKVVVSMWTEATSPSAEAVANEENAEEVQYIFKIESVSFDPNIKILSLPGMPAEVSAQDLGIHIGVVGELGVSEEGTGLFGAIGFKTKGTLPPLMRLLPKSVLQGAVEMINKQIVTFAISNFQRGATAEYGKYRSEVLAEYARRKKQQQVRMLQREQI
jgi:hypothetical protein